MDFWQRSLSVKLHGWPEQKCEIFQASNVICCFLVSHKSFRFSTGNMNWPFSGVKALEMFQTPSLGLHKVKTSCLGPWIHAAHFADPPLASCSPQAAGQHTARGVSITDSPAGCGIGVSGMVVAHCRTVLTPWTSLGSFEGLEEVLECSTASACTKHYGMLWASLWGVCVDQPCLAWNWLLPDGACFTAASQTWTREIWVS